MPESTLTEEKRELRARLRMRPAVMSTVREELSETIASKIAAAPWWIEADVVAAFIGVRHEPATTSFLVEALDQGKRVLLPRVDGDRLRWGPIASSADLEPGRFGLWEPPARWTEPALAKVDVALVPGLAFGRCGARIGWGRGYYDRALSEAGARVGLRVGVSVGDRLDPPEGAIPTGPSDVAMEAIVTEAGVLRASRSSDPAGGKKLQ